MYEYIFHLTQRLICRTQCAPYHQKLVYRKTQYALRIGAFGEFGKFLQEIKRQRAMYPTEVSIIVCRFVPTATVITWRTFMWEKKLKREQSDESNFGQ